MENKLKNIIDYSKAPKVLEIKNLRVNFKTDSGTVYAVRGVSFDLYKGETLCIVGESGSGKSVTSKVIMGISSSNAQIASGQVLYEGEDLVRISEEEFHRIRGKKIGMIFQDPLSSLNPIMRVGKQITEATLISRNIIKKHYFDLISEQLVAFRNADANAFYEANKIKEELQKLDEYLKALTKKEKEVKSDKELDEKALEALEALKKEQEELEIEIREFIALLDSNLVETISSLEYKLQSLKQEKFGENKYLEQEINEANVKTIEDSIALQKEFRDFILKKKDSGLKEDAIEIIKKRIEFLKNLAEFNKTSLKTIKPLYKKALNLRKVDAKVENSKYKEEVVSKYKTKALELKTKLDEVNAKIKEKLPKLSESSLNVYKNILKAERKEKLIYSRFARFFANSAIKNVETNISKITKKEEEQDTTGRRSFDELLRQRKEILNQIELLEEDYANKVLITHKEAKKMALKVMKEVGIPLPERRFYQYPFEFSGGMRQRIVIAIALTANPDILICDEPTTALDVTIQAQILELINRLKKERGLSCIFITHDLGVVANMADRVAVMYAGKIVEYGTAYEIFYNPKHPYTWALLSSIPDIDSKEKLDAIAGTPPDMRFPPKGDAFALRSKYALAIDFKYEPPFFKISDTHYAATWLLHKDAPKVEMPSIVKTRIANSLAQFKKEHHDEETLKQIPQESFTYKAANPKVQSKIIKKNIELYQHVEENPSTLVKDKLKDELHSTPPSLDELKGVKDSEKEKQIKSIKAKCKYINEYEKDKVILSVNHLKQYFFFGSLLNKYKLKAVHDVSFKVKEGECFGIVGESGCGKTTTGRCIMRLYHITSGSIYYKGFRIGAGSRWNDKEIKYTNIRYRQKLKDLKRDLKEGTLYEWEYKEEIKKVKDYKNNVVRVQKAKISQIKHDDKHAKSIITRPGYFEQHKEVQNEVKSKYKEDLNNLKALLDSGKIDNNKYLEEEAKLKARLNEKLKENENKYKESKLVDGHVSRKLMNEIQMIFQDPIDSLDPRMTVEDIIQEGLVIQGFRNRKENHKKVVEVLEKVGLIEDYCNRYPHEFSGGQRQRIGIARALIMNPKLLICDEPISALDVSIRAQIINLLNELKEELSLTILFIAHDLSVVKYFCDRIAVMYFGELVELATSDELFKHPLHPYTKSLLSAIPKPNPLTEKERVRIVYDPTKEHDYTYEKPTLVEITKDHFILASSSEVKKYKEEIRRLDNIRND